MSWYSQLYTKVRALKARRPWLGALVSALLYTPVVLQLIGILCSWGTYTVLTCLLLLDNDVQRVVYLTVYHVLLGMAVWSLFATVCTPVARVPDHYRVDADVHRRLKAIMRPAKEEKITAPTPDALAAQKLILETEATARGLVLHEVDTFDRIRYCLECGLVKPDRANHCWSCGFCVVKWDHHCPYLNTCISHANYKFYLLYMFYGGLLVVWALGSSVEVAVRFFWEHRWEQLPINILVLFMMCVYTLAVFPFAMLICFHFGLVKLNETTSEQVKVPRIRGRWADYNQGWRANVAAVFGGAGMSVVLWLCPVRTRRPTDGLCFPLVDRPPASPSPPVVVVSADHG